MNPQSGPVPAQTRSSPPGHWPDWSKDQWWAWAGQTAKHIFPIPKPKFEHQPNRNCKQPTNYLSIIIIITNCWVIERLADSCEPQINWFPHCRNVPVFEPPTERCRWSGGQSEETSVVEQLTKQLTKQLTNIETLFKFKQVTNINKLKGACNRGLTFSIQAQKHQWTKQQ